MFPLKTLSPHRGDFLTPSGYMIELQRDIEASAVKHHVRYLKSFS